MRGLKKEGDSIGAKVTVVLMAYRQAGVNRYLTVWMRTSLTR